MKHGIIAHVVSVSARIQDIARGIRRRIDDLGDGPDAVSAVTIGARSTQSVDDYVVAARSEFRAEAADGDRNPAGVGVIGIQITGHQGMIRTSREGVVLFPSARGGPCIRARPGDGGHGRNGRISVIGNDSARAPTGAFQIIPIDLGNYACLVT